MSLPKFIDDYHFAFGDQRKALGECWCLWADDVGVIHGTLCKDRAAASLLASDRKENGEGFENEIPIQVKAAARLVTP